MTTPKARELARESLAGKRELWRALAGGAGGLEAEAIVQAAAQLRQGTSWLLVNLDRLALLRAPGLPHPERNELRAHVSGEGAAA